MLAILYSDGSQECQRAISLFQSLEQRFIEYRLGRDFTCREFIDEFGEEARYPQVAIGVKHVGGLKETMQYYKLRNVL